MGKKKATTRDAQKRARTSASSASAAAAPSQAPAPAPAPAVPAPLPEMDMSNPAHVRNLLQAMVQVLATRPANAPPLTHAERGAQTTALHNTLVQLWQAEANAPPSALPLEWCFPREANFQNFRGIDPWAHMPRDAVLGLEELDTLRRQGMVCLEWAGYTPPAGMNPVAVFTRDDHLAFMAAQKQYGKDWAPVSQAIGKPMGLVACYAEALKHIAGLLIIYGHILCWRDVMMVHDAEDLMGRLGELFEMLYDGSFYTSFAPVFFHEIFKRAGGGRVPDKFRVLYAIPPEQADAEAEERIAQLQAEHAKRVKEAECKAFAKTLVGVDYRADYANYPWQVQVMKGQGPTAGFPKLTEYFDDVFCAMVSADGGFRKKHGVHARTNTDMTWPVPTFKDPLVHLPPGTRFHQHEGRGNLTDAEVTYVRDKQIFSYGQLYELRVNNRVVPYRHMTRDDPAFKYLVKQMRLQRGAPPSDSDSDSDASDSEEEAITAPPAPTQASLPIQPPTSSLANPSQAPAPATPAEGGGADEEDEWLPLATLVLDPAPAAPATPAAEAVGMVEDGEWEVAA